MTKIVEKVLPNAFKIGLDTAEGSFKAALLYIAKGVWTKMARTGALKDVFYHSTERRTKFSTVLDAFARRA